MNFNIKGNSYRPLSSDHNPVILNISGKLNHLQVRKVLNYGAADWKQFRSHIDNKLCVNLQATNVNEVDALLERFQNITINEVHESTPTHIITNHFQKLPPFLLILRKIKNSVKKTFLLSCYPWMKRTLYKLIWLGTELLQLHRNSSWSNML